MVDVVLDRPNSQSEEGGYGLYDEVVELPEHINPEPDAIFHAPPKGVPQGSVPIYDDQIGAVVGYRYEGATGVFHLYDLNGKVVGMEELPLEEPLFNPIDLVFVVGGLVKMLARGAMSATTRSAARVATATAGRLAATTFSEVVRGAMRLSLRNIGAQELRFTVTTASRMASAGRYVPRHILALAIRHGRRELDPQGAGQAAKYIIDMFRNGKKYELHVVLRESDRTVLHFHYFTPR